MQVGRRVHKSGKIIQRSIFNVTQRYFSAPLPQHIETPENNADTFFEFTPENMKEIERTLAKYPSNYKQSACIPLLWIAQEQNDNWVPLAAMNKIAEILEIHPMRVYEVATFYTMFNRKKIGKFHLQICGTTPCLVRGADKILATCAKYLQIGEGETTPDGLFTINEVECLACCANAPMMQVNNQEMYEDLTPENTIQLIENLKNGTAKVGSQIGRNQAEGLKRTTLLDGPPDVWKSQCRNFDEMKKELEQSKEQKPP